MGCVAAKAQQPRAPAALAAPTAPAAPETAGPAAQEQAKVLAQAQTQAQGPAQATAPTLLPHAAAPHEAIEVVIEDADTRVSCCQCTTRLVAQAQAQAQ
eukprot:CAMPEP_0198512664 /NCGR_PEP_ID=MMETSP1462-20131121/15591_1 /TAXON_ID=1333877 /ORGANISM="Brandtodinium nutriculum, Strain RCC3387" /LENGTH=98 /DNA_ID=CAMNT_0044242073 /DNA_START=66 /DNA_END=359 /DNA_ORIENTATION=+